MLTLLLLKSREVIAIRPLLVLGAKAERFYISERVADYGVLTPSHLMFSMLALQ